MAARARVGGMVIWEVCEAFHQPHLQPDLLHGMDTAWEAHTRDKRVLRMSVSHQTWLYSH